MSEPTKNSGSWFGRFGLWGKRETTSGPIKASLGEEKTFYYDKELKRWVNKVWNPAFVVDLCLHPLLRPSLARLQSLLTLRRRRREHRPLLLGDQALSHLELAPILALQLVPHQRSILAHPSQLNRSCVYDQI